MDSRFDFRGSIASPILEFQSALKRDGALSSQSGNSRMTPNGATSAAIVNRAAARVTQALGCPLLVLRFVARHSLTLEPLSPRAKIPGA